MLVKRVRTLGKFKPWTKIIVTLHSRGNPHLIWPIFFFFWLRRILLKRPHANDFCLWSRYSDKNQIYPPAWINQKMNKIYETTGNEVQGWGKLYSCPKSLPRKCFQATVLEEESRQSLGESLSWGERAASLERPKQLNRVPER